MLASASCVCLLAFSPSHVGCALFSPRSFCRAEQSKVRAWGLDAQCSSGSPAHTCSVVRRECQISWLFFRVSFFSPWLVTDWARESVDEFSLLPSRFPEVGRFRRLCRRYRRRGGGRMRAVRSSRHAGIILRFFTCFSF